VARLVQGGPCLDHDRAVHAGGRELRQQLVERVRAPQHVELGGHPRVGLPLGIEDVLVCVDDPGHAGTGASGGMSPSVRRSSQSAAGIGSRMAVG